MNRSADYRETVGCIPVFVGSKPDAEKRLCRLQEAGLGDGSRILPKGNDTVTFMVLVTRQALQKRERIFSI